MPGASALDLEDAVLPDAVVGQAYAFQLEGRAGCESNYRFEFASGRLPPGLVVRADGLITGTAAEAGFFEFYVELTDGDCKSFPSQGKFEVTVLPPLVVTTTALPPVRVGAPYALTLVASGGGTQRWSVSAGSLPPGLALREDGSLTGPPTSVGSFTFTVKVLAGPRTATQQLTLVVAAPLAVSPPGSRPAEVGVRFTATPTTIGGAAPFTWIVARGSLPGLALETATGTVSGTPNAAGSFPVTLSVTDGTGATASLEMTVTVASRLAITTTRLAQTTLGRAYRARLRTRGGVGPVGWKIVRGRLPRGIRLDARTGTLVGAARIGGRFRFTVQATDALGARAARTVLLGVRA